MAAEFLTYSVRTALCIAVFYLFFKLLLSRETFHAFNRRLVLAATVVSFVLPLCVITVRRTLPAGEVRTEAAAVPMPLAVAAAEGADVTESPVAVPADALSADTPSAAAADAGSVVAPPAAAEMPVTAAREFEIPWRQVACVAYLLGVAVVAGLTLRSVVQLRRLTRRGRRERLDDGTTLVRVDGNVTPISWCRNIVISERDLRENGEAILAHERAHVRLHHSLDLMLVDLAGAVQWFNPAMWLLRRDLRAIHEYEADAAVIASGVDARSYQLLLIRKAVGGRWYSIANSFNHSKLKNRITMMLREKSSRRTRARALLLLPLAGLALGAFAETVYVRPEHKVTKEISENASSFEEKASVAAADAVAARGGYTPPRGSNDAVGGVTPDTTRLSDGPVVIEGGEDLPPEVREQIKAFFESDEWKQGAQELKKLGEYFESDEWREAMRTMAFDKMEAYFGSDEWKQKVQELEKLGEYFESDEWKQKMQEIEDSGKELEEYFNSDERKELLKIMTSDTIRLGDGTIVVNNNIASDGRQTQGAIRTEGGRVIISDNWGDSLSPEERERLKDFFESDEWQKAQAKLKEMGDYFSSDDWQKNSGELKRLGEYFNSDEWREAWKHAGQAASNGGNAYFQSDEWKSIKEKLDAWRAGRDGSAVPEWVAEARRDLERRQEALREDMAETQQRITETQQKIARVQDAIEQSGDDDRRIRREMKKTHREMEKTHREMARAEEEMAQARQELEQAAREAGQTDR